MGRIKTQMIKRLTKKIVENYRPELTKEFETNKLAVSKHLSVQNKKLRNVIAGYVTRLMKSSEDMM